MPPIIFQITESLLQLLGETLPWFLGGVAAAALIESRMHWDWLRRLVERAAGSTPTAALAGALLPGCAVTTVPLALMLRKRGARIGTLMAFIVTSALLGPTSIIMTLTLLRWEFSLARLVLPFLAVIPLGLLMNRYATGPSLTEAAEAGALETGRSCCKTSGNGCSEDPLSRKVPFGRELWGMLKTLLPLLLIGLLAVAILDVLIPRETILPRLEGGVVAYLLAAVVAIPVYVCEGGEVILTRALLEFGVGPGPAFTFLQASVGTCLPTILLAPRIIGVAPTAAYVVFWFAFAILSGVLIGVWL